MKPLINLSLRTEFSFRKTFGPINKILNHENGTGYIGIADINGTYGHVYLEKICKGKNIIPIFGARLEVLPNLEKTRGICGPIYVFLAKNKNGVSQINNLVSLAWKNFYYKPRISYREVEALTEDVFVIAESVDTLDYRIDYLGLTPSTSRLLLELNLPKVYLNDNFFSKPEDRKIYEIIAGSEKRGDEYYCKFNTTRSLQHVLSAEEFDRIWHCPDALENTYLIAEQCKAKLPVADMVRYPGIRTIEGMCKSGAKKKKINLVSGEYADRYNREIKLIKEKDYQDYFLIVADIIREAKETMLVGPSRGSSAGSLVCYLMGITEIDPIIHGLVFERFIDINRNDLPDIDVDFPDSARERVIKKIFATYGRDKVSHISNINKYKEKSAIDEIGISLRIPKREIELLKASIIEKTGGISSTKMTMSDILSSEFGKQFLEKYPAMAVALEMQDHATHVGKHAAGIIVCNDPISKFGSVNAREESVMLDKKGAEQLNLLKIDILGLRTLSILQDCAEQIGMNYLAYYSLPLDDEKTFAMFNSGRLNGIFQFEGRAMQMLCSKMTIDNFNDVVAITALARPGPLQSGGAYKYVNRKMGREDLVYISNNPLFIEQTKETFGIIAYQEQLMKICRECGSMSWEDVTNIRRAASKTLGKEFFNTYREKFMTGAIANGIKEDDASELWENMVTFGSWGMNKSHTVSYGHISYWCAYMKAHHPLEFTVANLRHAKTEDSALKILRDAKENDGIDYVPVDPDESEIHWSVKNGKMIGGLTNIKGVAERKAKEIIECRKGKKAWTKGLVNLLLDPETPYDSLYPCYDKWREIYECPEIYGLNFPPTFVKDIKENEEFVFLGKVIKINKVDLNGQSEVIKRGGKILKDNTFSLRIYIEDDTGGINCSVNRMLFDKLGCNKLADELVENKSYVIVKGRTGDSKYCSIQNIFNLANL